MKRSLLFVPTPERLLVIAGTALIAGTYGLVRLAYGLFLPDITASVPMATAAAGYVASAASVAYCLGASAGFVLDHRPRALVVAAVGTASGGSAAMASATTPWVLAPAVVVASTGAGLASPALVTVVARSVRRDRADRAQAVVNAGTGPGLVAAGCLALLLPDWRVAFVTSAAVVALAAGGVLLLDRGGPAPGRSGGESGSSVHMVLRVPIVAAMLLGAGSAVTWTYGRTLLAATGADAGTTIAAWVALGAGGTATVLTAGLLGAMSPQRAWLLSTATVALATAVLGLAGATVPAAIVACAAFGWGFVAASSSLIAWAADGLPSRAAAGTSLLFVSLVLGQAIGAALAGWLSGVIGMPGAFVVGAGLAAVAAMCGRRRTARVSALAA